MSTMSATAAQAALPEILDRVLAGEEITITRHGKAIAVVVSADALRVRRANAALADAEIVRDLLNRARNTPLTDAPAVGVARAEDLVAEVATSRSTR